MRWRCGWAAASSALLLATGCGSATRDSAARRPLIPRPVATSLAARAEAVAVALDRGDRCSARGEAQALERAAARARLPAVYRGRLLRAVGALAAALPACVATAPPPAISAEDGKPSGGHGGHEKRGHEKRGHGKKKGKEH